MGKGLSMLETPLSSEPTYNNMKQVLTSAIAKAGSVGREGVKLIRERVIQSSNSNGNVIEPECPPSGLIIEKVLCSKDVAKHMQDNFEEFQAHHNAKLESWLTEE